MTSNKAEHIRWLVKRRSENQACCLELYDLLGRYQKEWIVGHCYFASQAMVGAAFSLWRAVFLADKKEATRKAVLKHSLSFLESVITDNAISYLTDKNNNESTFNYYVENSRRRLIFLTEEWPKLLAPWEHKKREPAARWVYNQDRLSDAVSRFGTYMARSA